jgi:glycosyltransferase involved in cell wall biosynthesis
VSSLGIRDRVRFTGSFPWDSDVPSSHLAAADAAVYPFDDGISDSNSSVIAAADHGLPLIATESDLTPSQIDHGRRALLSQPKDVYALVENMIAVATNPGLRRQLAQGARELSDELWSREGAAAAMDAVVARVLAKP